MAATALAQRGTIQSSGGLEEFKLPGNGNRTSGDLCTHSSIQRGSRGARKVGRSSHPCTPSITVVLPGSTARINAENPLMSFTVLLKLSCVIVFTDLQTEASEGKQHESTDLPHPRHSFLNLDTIVPRIPHTAQLTLWQWPRHCPRRAASWLASRLPGGGSET